MPDSGLPRWAQLLGRSLRVLAYLLTITVAAGDTWWPSTTIEGVVPEWQLRLTASAMVGLGLAGAAAVVAHRWRVEWVCASAATFLLLGRAAPVWASVDDVPTRLAAAAMMTLACVGLAARALDLWVFAVKTAAAARGARARRRRESA